VKPAHALLLSLALGALLAGSSCVSASTSGQSGDASNGGEDGQGGQYTASDCKAECNNRLSTGCFVSYDEFETCYSLCNSGTAEELEPYVACLQSSTCDFSCSGASNITALAPTAALPCSEQCAGFNDACESNAYTDAQLAECSMACDSPLDVVLTDCMTNRPCDDLLGCVEASPQFAGALDCVALCEDLADRGCLLNTTPCLAGCFFDDEAARTAFGNCVDQEVGQDSCMVPSMAAVDCVQNTLEVPDVLPEPPGGSDP